MKEISVVLTQDFPSIMKISASFLFKKTISCSVQLKKNKPGVFIFNKTKGRRFQLNGSVHKNIRFKENSEEVYSKGE